MSITLNNKQENEKIKQEVIALYELEAKYKKIKKSYEEKKENLSKAIRNFMYCTKGANNEFRFYAQSGDTFSKENKMLQIRRIVPKTIVWDLHAIESKFSKEVTKQLIDKQYVITDIDALIAYLKECNVDPKKFKSFLEVTKVVNEQKLEQLSATGIVTEEELEGCYTVKEKSSYLRIDIVEGDV